MRAKGLEQSCSLVSNAASETGFAMTLQFRHPQFRGSSPICPSVCITTASACLNHSLFSSPRDPPSSRRYTGFTRAEATFTKRSPNDEMYMPYPPSRNPTAACGLIVLIIFLRMRTRRKPDIVSYSFWDPAIECSLTLLLIGYSFSYRLKTIRCTSCPNSAS